MATAVQKITLSSSRDIPFNRLVLSQSNVRRVKAGVSIEELAEDIARRTLLQSITVRPILDESGAETGMFEIPAGGRRYRALELLVKQKRLLRTAPIPCVVRTEGTPEEDSLAENVQRAPLHPLDQFRAFLALREKGQSEEEIAAAFFVGVNVVKQRLRLASVSPTLLDVYADDGMTLDQLMGFTVSSDHEQIAWHLARFIENVRAIPADPIIVRQNWLKAYDFVTDKGAHALNDYARANDPFAKVGQIQIAVDVTSVIRASTDSFRIAWTERRYENASLASTERWSAILTIAVQPSRDAERLRKNPLGLFIHAINWSKELG